MKPLVLFKVGGTFPDLAARLGDFEDWFARGLGLCPPELGILDITRGGALPDPARIRGAVITGSHAMVTERSDWSEALAEWLRSAVPAGLPVLGVCYGHQLLAQALGGAVDYLPGVPEVGTVPVRLTPAGRADALLGGLSQVFAAHATHAQSVRCLPPGAVHLAENDVEPHHAFRVGERAWGVQFHPEFDREVMLAYVDYRMARCENPQRDWPSIRAAVTDTPEPAGLLKRFLAIADTAP
ncbi:MAG TPA: glutamine amidotransferase [Thiobacillaceae bacterium]|nr:glutamine amidotransferase [Thiobacillaceae bacterium]